MASWAQSGTITGTVQRQIYTKSDNITIGQAQAWTPRVQTHPVPTTTAALVYLMLHGAYVRQVDCCTAAWLVVGRQLW